MGGSGVVGQLKLAHDLSSILIIPGDEEVEVPSSVRSSQFPTIPGALMTANGGSGLDGKPTTTHRADDDRNAPTCSIHRVANDKGTKILAPTQSCNTGGASEGPPNVPFTRPPPPPCAHGRFRPLGEWRCPDFFDLLVPIARALQTHVLPHGMTLTRL